MTLAVAIVESVLHLVFAANLQRVPRGPSFYVFHDFTFHKHELNSRLFSPETGNHEKLIPVFHFPSCAPKVRWDGVQFQWNTCPASSRAPWAPRLLKSIKMILVSPRSTGNSWLMSWKPRSLHRFCSSLKLGSVIVTIQTDRETRAIHLTGLALRRKVRTGHRYIRILEKLPLELLIREPDKQSRRQRQLQLKCHRKWQTDSIASLL